MEPEDETIQINVFNPKDFKKKVLQVEKKDSSLQILKDFKENLKKISNVALPKSFTKTPKENLFNPSKKLNIEQKHEDELETDEKSFKQKVLNENIKNVNKKCPSIVNEDSIKQKKKEPSLKKKSTNKTIKNPLDSDVKTQRKLKRKLDNSTQEIGNTKKFKSSVIHNCDMETPTLQKLLY